MPLEALMQTAIHTPYIKLEALLKLSGIAATGGHAKEIITSGDVRIKGKAVYERGRKIYPGFVVTVEGFEESIEVISEPEAGNG